MIRARSFRSWVQSRPEFRAVAKQSHPRRLCAVAPSARTPDTIARIAQWLSGVELLAGASEPKLAAVARVVTYRAARRGSVLRAEDRDGPGPAELCVVYSGQVALCREGRPVAYLEAGQAFGAIETIQSELSGAAAVATGVRGAELLVLRQSDYDEAAQRFRAAEAWEDVEFLESHPLFEGWGRSELLSLRGAMLHRVVPAGEVVCRQGEEPRSLWLLKRGVCEAQRTRTEHVAFYRGRGSGGTKTVRRRLLLGRVLPGGLFGESALVRGTPRFADVITVTVAELLELPGPSLLLLAKHGTLGALGEQVSRYPTDEAVEARLEAMVRGDEGARKARSLQRRERLGRLAMQWSSTGVQGGGFRDADATDLMHGAQVTGTRRRRAARPAAGGRPDSSGGHGAEERKARGGDGDAAGAGGGGPVGSGRRASLPRSPPPPGTKAGQAADPGSGEAPGSASPGRRASRLSALVGLGSPLRASVSAVQATARMNRDAVRRMVRAAMRQAPEQEDEREMLDAARQLQRAGAGVPGGPARAGSGPAGRGPGRVLGAAARRGSVSAVVGSTLTRLESTGGVRLDTRRSVHIALAAQAGDAGSGPSSRGKGTILGASTAAGRLVAAMRTQPSTGTPRSAKRGPTPPETSGASSALAASSSLPALPQPRLAGRRERRSSITRDMQSRTAAAIAPATSSVRRSKRLASASTASPRRSRVASDTSEPVQRSRFNSASIPGVIPAASASLLSAASRTHRPPRVRAPAASTSRLAASPPGSPLSALFAGASRSAEVGSALRAGSLTLQEAGRSMGLSPLLRRGHAHVTGLSGGAGGASAEEHLSWKAIRGDGGGWKAAAAAGAAAQLQRRPTFVGAMVGRDSLASSAGGMLSRQASSSSLRRAPPAPARRPPR